MRVWISMCCLVLWGTASSAEVITVVGPDAGLDTPFGVGMDRQGTLYIAEFDGGRIFKLAPGGSLTHIAGDGGKSYRGDGGPAKDAGFNGMHTLVVTPAGALYVADTLNHCVRKIDSRTGTISTIAGTGQPGFSGDGGPATKATFRGIYCVALDGAGDRLILTDLENRRIRAVDLKTGIVETVAGNGEKGVPRDGEEARTSPLVDPRAAAADSKGNVYILERGGHALRVVDTQGKIYTVAGTGKPGAADGPGRAASLRGPKHLCIDRDDSVLIADAENHLIRKYDPGTKTLVRLVDRGPAGDAKPKLARPHGVYVHSDGTLFVVDSYNHRILKVAR